MFVTRLWEQNNKENGKQLSNEFSSNQYTLGYMYHLPPQRKEPLRTSGSPSLETDYLQFLLSLIYFSSLLAALWPSIFLSIQVQIVSLMFQLHENQLRTFTLLVLNRHEHILERLGGGRD